MKRLLSCLLAVFLVAVPFTIYGAMSGGVGGTPGGSDTQVQYNNAGIFAGDAEFTYNAVTNALTVGGVVTSGTNSRITFDDEEFIDGSTDGSIEFQGVGGADDTDLLFDLDGPSPTIGSPTDGVIIIDDSIEVQGYVGLYYDEYIDNGTDDFLLFQGVGGSNNTNIRLDLDGTHPIWNSPTDATIQFAEKVIFNSFTGTLIADGFTLGEGEYLTWDVAATPDETIHWDSTTHDYHFSDDGYFKDVNPGLYIWCTENDRAFGWHYHYGEAYPLAFLTGIHNGTEIVHEGLPLIASDNDGTEIEFPKGIGDEAPFNKTAYYDEMVDNGSSSTADTIDWRAGNKQKSTLTDDCTFTFSPNPRGPCSVYLELYQGGGGSHTVTWPENVRWPSDTAPTLTPTATYMDAVTFVWNGTNYIGNSSLNYLP